MCLAALYMYYEEDLHHSHKCNIYMNTRKNQWITEYWYIVSKYTWHHRETYKISTTPVFHIYYTGEIYKTIFAIKVETSKCHNSVWTQTLEIFCPLKKSIRLNAMHLSLSNKSPWGSWWVDMPPATSCQMSKYVQLVNSITQTRIVENFYL